MNNPPSPMVTKTNQSARVPFFRRWLVLTAISFHATLRLCSQTADGFNPGVTNTGSFSVIAVQPDGKVLVGGLFTKLSGQTRHGFGRLNSDGTLDSTFNPSSTNTVLGIIGVQSDGKILVNGTFKSLAGQERNGFGRLNPDGALDANFNPSIGGSVYSFAVQPDGKILVGGLFTNLAGEARANLGRLNPNGSLDAAFNPAADGLVGVLLLQPDGKILVSGDFKNLAGELRPGIGRLHANGTLDTNFNVQASASTPFRAIQADGRILVGGSFTNIGGYPLKYLARLEEDGSVDASFDAKLDYSATDVAIQCDGRILIGGGFTNVAGHLRRALVRLESDGTLDTNFNAQLTRTGLRTVVWVNSVVIQADGKTLLGGAFASLAGQPRDSIGRLNSTGPATQSLAFDGTTITWLRGGVSPEVYRTSFESSTDGVNWTNLGVGARIVGGWQCTNVSVPNNANLRARGFVSRGRSEWFVENTTRPTISLNDGNFGFRSNQFGFHVGGNPGQVVVVEVSMNMSNWIPVATNTLGSGPVYFSDPDSTTSASRLYRTHTP